MRDFDPGAVLRIAHGRRTNETLREIAPGMDIDAEVALLESLESVEARGLNVVPGAAELVRQLKEGEWAIVTSGSPKVALFRMRHCGIPTPRVFVTAHDVANGKPAPDGYLAAARELEQAPGDCLVIEDTPAGVAAGKSAGAKVLAVEGTTDAGSLDRADRITNRLSAIHVRHIDGGKIVVSLSGH